MAWSSEQVIRSGAEPVSGTGEDSVDPQITTAPRLDKGVVSPRPRYQLGYQETLISQPRQRSVGGMAEGDLPQRCTTDQHRPMDANVLRGQVDLWQVDRRSAIARS
jgi:hypothetical protein